MGYHDFEEIEVKTIIGIDEEKEDREVGIFGSVFNLAIGDDKEHPHHLYFGEDEFLELLNVLRPFYEEQKAQDDYAQEQADLYEDENKLNDKRGIRLWKKN